MKKFTVTIAAVSLTLMSQPAFSAARVAVAHFAPFADTTGAVRIQVRSQFIQMRPEFLQIKMRGQQPHAAVDVEADPPRRDHAGLDVHGDDGGEVAGGRRLVLPHPHRQSGVCQTVKPQH